MAAPQQGAASTGNADAGEAPDPRRWRALTVCLIVGFMTLLDVSIVNVALPSIRAGLKASESDLQWVLSGYALTFGLVLVPAGRLGDARGRRTMFLVGLVGFTLASAAAGLAPAPIWLTVARLVQGAAGGLLNPQVAGLIQQLFRGAERGKAFGLLGATIGISTAIGPVLGGTIIHLVGPADGWRWIFYVNVPVGIVAVPLARALIPQRERPKQRHREDLDPVGVGLIGVGLVLLLLPLVEEQQWHGSLKWLLALAGALVLAGFVAWERRYRARGRQPVADLPLFRIPSYGFGTALAVLYFAGFTSIFFTFTLYLQNGLGYSALVAGAAITPFAVGAAVASALGGRTVTKYGRPLVAIGLALVVLGLLGCFVGVLVVPGHAVAYVTAGPLLVGGLGSGLVISPNQTLTLAEVPVRGGGSAAGVLQTGQRIGSAIGIAAVGSVFFSTVASTRGDWARAFRDSVLVIGGFVLASLLVAGADLVLGRRRARGADPEPVPAAAGRRG